jgi:hypothetical protein
LESPVVFFAGSFDEGQVYDKKYGKQSSLDSWFCAGAEAWIQAGVVEKAQFTDDRGVSYAKHLLQSRQIYA